MLVTVCSPGRSPGVSTTALALALTWPRDVILAECDPAGGTALTGLWTYLLPAKGLPQWAMAVSRGADPATELTAQLQQLAGQSRRLLALPPGPAPLGALRSRWDQLAGTFTTSATDVITDIGRIGGTDTPLPLLTSAGTVLLQTRPRYQDLAAATAVLRHLDQTSNVKLLLEGDGPYPEKAIRHELPVPVADTRIPHDPKTAAALTSYRPRLARRNLTRATAALAKAITDGANHV